MIIRRRNDIVSSEITPLAVWQRRRTLLRAAVSLGLLPLAARAQSTGLRKLDAKPSALSTMERPTAADLVTSYNNFSEFGSSKGDPSRLAPSRLMTRPWTVQVEGEVKRPRAIGIEELLKLAPLEERIYRLRCVETWSAVVPWIGFPLSELLNRMDPTGNAKYVEFTTLADPKQMPGVANGELEFPYVEGLRMDEAMHPLTILAVGMYGTVLPNQDGAPIRLIVPWKYGFKSAKSLVRIRLVEKQPLNTWSKQQPKEYGFFANVNPGVDHPRWSQASERRLGEDGLFSKRRPTLMLNGYADQVAALYAGMDLTRFY
jgi:methionine sulfoxide reductase catalytic subunit